jgi:hypothetical protein
MIEGKFASSSIAELWDSFEEVDSSAKLVLPDARTAPFYLPVPRNTAAQQEEKLLKELKRFNIMCSLECESTVVSNMHNIMSSIPHFKLKGKER